MKVCKLAAGAIPSSFLTALQIACTAPGESLHFFQKGLKLLFWLGLGQNLPGYFCVEQALGIILVKPNLHEPFLELWAI